MTAVLTCQCDELRKRLAEAREARHTAMISGAVTMLRMGEKHLMFDKPRLDEYILELSTQINACCGLPGFRPRRAIVMLP